MEYKDPGYFLLVSTPHGVGEEQMKVRLSSEFNARKHPDAPFRASMEAFWEERLQEPGITLFDASKYRVHSSVLRIEKSAEEETHDVELRLGVTSYKEFITTNAHPKWFTLIEEEEQFNFYEAMRTELAGEALMGGRFLSHPAGVSVALVTSDGKIPLLLRSGKVAEIKDCLAFPGGHAEPERALLSAESLIEAERRFLEGDAEVKDYVDNSVSSFPSSFCFFLISFFLPFYLPFLLFRFLSFHFLSFFLFLLFRGKGRGRKGGVCIYLFFFPYKLIFPFV